MTDEFKTPQPGDWTEMPDDCVEHVSTRWAAADLTRELRSPTFCAYWDAARSHEPGRECAWRLKQLWLAEKVGNDAEAAEAAQWLSEYHTELDRRGFEIGPVFTKSGRGPFTGIRKKLGAAA